MSAYYCPVRCPRCRRIWVGIAVGYPPPADEPCWRCLRLEREGTATDDPSGGSASSAPETTEETT